MKRIILFALLVSSPFCSHALLAEGDIDDNLMMIEEELTNSAQPINLDSFPRNKLAALGFDRSGKIILEFDINDEGQAENIAVIAVTRKKSLNKPAIKLAEKFVFAPGEPKQNARYAVSICTQRKDSLITFSGSGSNFSATNMSRPDLVLCDIRFERVQEGNGDNPKVEHYSIPHYSQYTFDRSICGWVHVRFDVNKYGRVRKLRFLDSSPSNQFEGSVKEALRWFKFEKDMPAEGIEYKISFSLPGRCEVD